MTRAASTTVDVDRILRDRILASADRIIKMMPVSAKTAAISSIDVPALIFNIARGIPSVEPGDPEHTDAITKAIAFKRRLIDAAGGAFDAEAVRKLLGNKTVQAVYKAAKDRRLLMVDDNGAKLFPVFQFDGNTIIPALSRVLGAAPESSGWTILQYLVSGDEGLGNVRPIDLLRGSDAQIDDVVRFARTLDE